MEGQKDFRCVFIKRDVIIEVRESSFDSASEEIINCKNYLITYVRANTHNEASKIAYDRFSKYIADILKKEV